MPPRPGSWRSSSGRPACAAASRPNPGRSDHVAYTYERPDLRALDELETLVRHLLDELAGWRRRAIKAEAELQELRTTAGATGGDVSKVRKRVAELEAENQALRQRVDTARDRVRTLVGRLSFLEQGGETTT